MKKILPFLIILFAGFISSCKKDKKNNTPTSTINLIKDSVYYYEKEDYLWNDAIPSYSTFDPRSYTADNDLDALNSELFAISQLKTNPETNAPYEYYATDPTEPKYSFIDNGAEAASLNGTNADFGFEPAYIADDDLRVKYVYPGSPADVAGIKRGYQITSINGSTDLSSDDNTDLNYVINAVYYSTTITMVLLKPDETSITVTLNETNYTVNPVITYKTFNEGNGHIIGYIVFNSFTALSNAQPELDAAFNSFIANGVNDLVVDLRYNTGGVEKTAAYLDDLIVPADKSNTLMYTTYFNSNLQNDIYPLLAKKIAVTPGMFTVANNQTNFAKALSLNISRVFFIVTSETASSSELTINNLIPEMNVQLIGDTTYGKPVGEMPIPIGHYVLYSPQFSIENSASQGGYYNGMAPGSSTYPGILAGDDVTKNFGDSTEMLLAHALNYVQNGTYSIAIQKIQSFAQSSKPSAYQLKTMNRKFLENKFRGMVLIEKSK